MTKGSDSRLRACVFLRKRPRPAPHLPAVTQGVSVLFGNTSFKKQLVSRVIQDHTRDIL